jgi:hypothetical protein
MFTATFSLLCSCKDVPPKELKLSQRDLKIFDLSFKIFDLTSGIKKQSGNTTSYKISMPESKYDSLVKYTSNKNYSTWQRGEILNKHIKLGFGPNDQVFFSKKEKEGKTLTLCYDKINNYLYLINYNTGW